MISLIKNELIKIFHKKGIYIFLVIIAVILGIGVLSYSDYTNYEDYSYMKSWFEECDLSDEENIEICMSYINQYDTGLLKEKYDFYSPEYYYINNEISSTISEMNYAKYVYKDEISYNEIKVKYDEQVKSLDNFDWREIVEEQKEEYEKEREELKGLDISEYGSELKRIELELEGIDYRLRNNVAPSNNNSSYLVRNYIFYAMQYEEMNKDESSYNYREELISKREMEKDYELAKYKIKNNIVLKDESFRDEWLSLMTDMTIVYIIAILIIGGGIFSEEFNKGTIKQLLIKPFSRTKIYLSKLIALFIALVLFMLVYGVFTFVASFIINPDVSSMLYPIYEYSFKTHNVITYNTFSYFMLHGILPLIPMLLIIGLLCVFVGVLSTSTIGAIIIPLGVVVFKDFLSLLMSTKIMAFLPTMCWDFSDYLSLGLYYNKYMSLSLSICVCVVTIIVLFIMGLWIFNKKDVKNQ